MIRTIKIENYRCFKSLKIEDVARLTVIVGDNGSGKTALLEAMFLPLGTSSGLIARYRAQRGLDGAFNATRRRIEDALFGELFYKFQYNNPVRVELTGDGPETRAVTIARGEWQETPSSVAIQYVDSKGQERVLVPDFDAQGRPSFPETGEDIPNFFHFSANTATGSIETAGRFSDMSRARAQSEFVKTFTNEYAWLQDISIEVIAGAPSLYGTLVDTKDKIALANISGGIARMVAVMVAIASRKNAVVLVDEIENGIHYKHQVAIWKGLLRFLREHDGQMICTTHSQEWLEALVEAGGEKLDDVALWRVERGKDQPTVRQFSGATLRAGLEHGKEVRSNE
ncbi:MAG: ATP/GTP-binding protein [Hyphomicrobiaceae bacterium]|jgi:predicted ATPase